MVEKVHSEVIIYLAFLPVAECKGLSCLSSAPVTSLYCIVKRPKALVSTTLGGAVVRRMDSGRAVRVWVLLAKGLRMGLPVIQT